MPNVPTLEKQDKRKVANLTLRQRTELHRTHAVCNNCQKILDAIGRWRDQDHTGGKGVEGFCISKLNRREEAVSLLLEGIAGLEKERT